MLDKIPTDHLHAELQRRKGDEARAIRAKISEHKAAIATLEAKLIKPTKIRGPSVPMDERIATILGVMGLEGQMSAGELTERTLIDSRQLKAALDKMVANGNLKRTGKARGTKYELA